MAKRQVQGSFSLRGVFTRSRFEIFVHRTRSGCARPDPTGRRRHLASIPPPPSPDDPSPVAGGDRRIVGAAIKDLRARRVFSPSSISMEASPDKTDAIKSVEDAMELTDAAVEEEERVEQGDEDADEVAKPSDGPEEELVQSTPPDNRNAMEVETEGQDRRVLEVPEVSADVKTEAADPPKSRPALTRCSRSKLFRNPSSFSYRRLLPFLMNLEKDNSDGTQILSHKDYQVKVNNFVEETTSLPVAEQLPKDQLLVGSSKCSVPLESSETLSFVENQINASPDESPSNGDLHDLEVPTTNFCNHRELEFDEVKIETSPDAPILESKLLPCSSCSPAATGKALSDEESAENIQALSCLPSDADLGCSMIGPVLEIERKSPPRIPLLGSIHCLERQALAPRKGIMKKRTRGCKGICMCLDCVSFRIHADRAFDFSRKQMEEADEIIVGLVKELAGFRNLVEKSVLPTHQGSGTSVLFQLNQELLKGACQRASRAEEVANNRRKQMFNDLNNHCRIPGPRVTFAESVERMVPREQQESRV